MVLWAKNGSAAQSLAGVSNKASDPVTASKAMTMSSALRIRSSRCRVGLPPAEKRSLYPPAFAAAPKTWTAAVGCAKSPCEAPRLWHGRQGDFAHAVRPLVSRPRAQRRARGSARSQVVARAFAHPTEVRLGTGTGLHRPTRHRYY